jgi:hypothetical protein
MAQFKVWVFKVNTKRGWEFDGYFRSRTRGVYELGDEGWIRSASSLRHLREEVKRGDLFLCYEVDRKRVVGLGLAARFQPAARSRAPSESAHAPPRPRSHPRFQPAARSRDRAENRPG